MKEPELIAGIKWHVAPWPGTELWRCITGTFRSFHGHRVVQAGIKGAPDLVGWHWHLVKQEDVGKLIPVFAGIEVKTGTTVVKMHQRKFLHRLRRCGALAGVARSVEDAERLLNQDVGIHPVDLSEEDQEALK